MQRIEYLDRESDGDKRLIDELLREGWRIVQVESSAEEIDYSNTNQVREQRVIEWMLVLEKEEGHERRTASHS